MIDRFKEIRQKIFKTQDEMANALDIKKQSISDYERGRTSPNITTLQKLANDYDVNLNYLIIGKGNLLLSNNENVNINNEINQLKDKVKELEIENKLLKELVKK